MKKVVFVTARLPYPASSGQKNVMNHYCKILHEKYKYNVVIVSFMEAGDCVDPIPEFISKVYRLPDISTKTKLFNLLKYTLLQKKYPMQVSLYWDKNVASKIEEILKAEKPDVVMADMVRTTEYLKKYSGFKIADLCDMLSIRYKRQMNVNMRYVNPYGAYLYSLPAPMQQLLQINICKKTILSSEIKLLEKYERQISQIYDRTVFVAENEAKTLNQDNHFDKALSIPLGVDIHYFGQYFNQMTPENHTICFLGAMNVAHNEAGVFYFVTNVLPHILKQIPDVKFYVVGGGVTDRLKKLSSQNVIFTGRVDDVRSYVGKCQVFVCPLLFGSGIKTKSLEAMAMGVPIVTTTIGAENIDAQNGRDWFVTDHAEEFAEDVIKIIQQKELYLQLRKNAYQFVANHFTWKAAEDKFGILLDHFISY